MRIDLSRLSRVSRQPRARGAAAIALLLIVAALVWLLFPHIHRKPPSIFDTPVDGVLGYLAQEDFNRLSVAERMDFIKGIFARFNSMSQSDSAVASAFLAGLTGPANEKLIDNARILGKDIFVQGASDYLSLQTDRERDQFIDRWLVKWVRFGEEAAGRPSGRSDEQLLNRMSEQARRDVRRGIDINGEIAQQIMDFWDRDVASVASPKEQAQIFQFAPAIRKRLLNRGS